MEKQISFKSRARLMPQIGDQLIKNESIALLELWICMTALICVLRP